MTEQLALFNTELFANYDESIEPPDPDEYSSPEAYESAWAAWERKYPQLVSEVRAMSEDECDRYHAVLEHKGFTGEIVFKNSSAQMAITHGGKLCLTVEDDIIAQEATVYWFHREVEQLIYYGVGKNTFIYENPNNFVLEQVNNDTLVAVPEHDLTVPERLQWVETYHPSNRRDNEYYRYCYKEQGKIKHRHIPGGNVRSLIAQRRKAAVEIAIAAGKSPNEIEKIIRS